MSEHALGQVVTVQATFYVDDHPTNPTACTVTVRDPDGAESVVEPGSGGEGVKTLDITADKVGVWSYRFVGTGTAAGVYEDAFTVRESPVVGGHPTYTYDVATPLGELRLLIDDRDISNVSPTIAPEQRSCIFSDEELTKVLDRQGGDVYLAAGALLRVIASNRQLLVQSRRIGSRTVDYGNVRKDLMELAQTYITEATKAAGYEDPADGFAEINWDPFSGDRILTNALLRQN